MAPSWPRALLERDLRVLHVVLALATLMFSACPVDLPAGSRQTFACHINEDCVEGFLCVNERCVGADQDAGLVDLDAGLSDAAAIDARLLDTAGADVERADAGRADAGRADAGRADAGRADAGRADAGRADAGETDAGETDAGRADAGGADGGRADAGGADAGGTEAGGTEAGRTDGGRADVARGDAAVGDGAPPWDWMNPGWGQRVALYFDNSASTTELVELPVLVQLAAPDFDLTAIAAGGADLRFTPSDSHDLLPYEVTRADSQAFDVWVCVPSIPAGSTDTRIWMYFDNDGAPLRDDPPAVWSNGYAGVWHLEQEPVGAGAILDSLGVFHGTAAGSMQAGDQVEGQIGGALDFDGSDDTIDLGDLGTDTWTELTVETWYRQGNVGADPRLVCKSTGTGGGDHTFCMLAQGSSIQARINTEGSGYSAVNASGGVSSGVWVHSAMTWSADSARLEVFIAGEHSNGINKGGTSLRDSPQHVHLANNNSSDPRWYQGLIDEVRISNVARTPDWLRAQHLSMTGAFVRIGVVEQRP